MTRFWDIQLILDGTYSIEERKTVIVNSRSMVHFIERILYPLNFRSEFSRLVIHCSKTQPIIEFKKSKDPAIAFVNISQNIDGFTESNHSKYLAFENMLKHGFEVASKHVSLPKIEVLSAIEKFKGDGFENKWIHFEKTWKRKDLTCIIECDHQINTFQLIQKIFKSGQLVKEAIIGESIPREMLINQLLGKVVIKEGGKLVYSAKGKIISTFNISNNELDICSLR